MPTASRLAPPPRRAALGLVVTLGGTALVAAVLVPLRGRFGPDTPALALVVPVALGAAVGGFWTAPIGAVAGFLAYDFFFIPPYGTLRVGSGGHWIGLVAYAAVSVVVGVVVAQVQRARAETQRRADETEVLHELTRLLAAEPALDTALARVLTQLCGVLGLTGAAVLLPDGGGGLRVAAREGEPLPEHVLHTLAARRPRGDATTVSRSPAVAAIDLASAAGSLGVLVVSAPSLDDDGRRLLVPFARQVTLAVERAALAEEATRTGMLEEVDRLRSALLGSVSHDLRTPLASIKASVSDLLDSSVPLGDEDRAVLLHTIEEETDRLTRFVTNLLDYSRLEAGALELRRSATPLHELVGEAVRRLATVLARHRVRVDVPAELPLVDVDYVLVDHVLANLLENAARHAPPGSLIEITAVQLVPGRVDVRIADHGPGVPEAERSRIFELFYRGGTRAARAAGSGVGLAISKGVVAAHGGDIWIEPTPGGGATFAFRLPVVASSPAPPADTAAPDPAPTRTDA